MIVYAVTGLSNQLLAFVVHSDHNHRSVVGKEVSLYANTLSCTLSKGQRPEVGVIPVQNGGRCHWEQWRQRISPMSQANRHYNHRQTSDRITSLTLVELDNRIFCSCLSPDLGICSVAGVESCLGAPECGLVGKNSSLFHGYTTESLGNLFPECQGGAVAK
jgi:hypothetical protein